MKILRVIVKDIRNFIKERTLLFLVFILSLVIASFSFCIYMASNMHMVNIVNSYRKISNTYFIANKKKENISHDKIHELETWFKQSNIPNITIKIYSEILTEEKESIEENAKENHTYNSTEKRYNIFIGTNNNKSTRRSFVGNVISERDLYEDTSYVMIDYNNVNAKRNPFILNNTINIGGKTYTVRAIDRIDITEMVIKHSNINNYEGDIINETEAYVIPINQFLKNYEIYGIEIKTSDNLENEQILKINNYIKSKFNDYYLYLPQKTEVVELRDVKEQIFIFSILIVLAQVNILALFTYWIDKNWRKYMIYRICGANRKKIYALVTCEAVIISIISTILGSVLYYIFTPALAKFNVTYILKIKDICLINMILVFFVLMIISIVAINISCVNPRYIERR